MSDEMRTLGMVACALLILFALVMHLRSRPKTTPKPRPVSQPPLPGDYDQLLHEGNQLELLGRYGVQSDAERLIEQGIDLEALGYRPPSAS